MLGNLLDTTSFFGKEILVDKMMNLAVGGQLSRA